MIKIFLLIILLGYQEENVSSLDNGEAWRQLGISEKNKGNYQKALKYYRQAKNNFIQKGDSSGLASVYNNIGIVKFYTGKFDSCLIYYQESLKLFERLEDQNGIGKVNIGLGNYFSYHDKNLTKALDHYTICKNIFTELDNQYRLMTINNNIGNIFKSKKYEGYSLDSAKNYYQKSIILGFQLIANDNLSNNQIISLQNQIGGSYMNIGLLNMEENIDSAVYYYQKAIELFHKTENQDKIASVYTNIANLHNDSNRKESIKYNKLAYNIAVKIKSWDIIHGVSKNLYEIYRESKQFDSAIKYSTRYIASHDTVFNKNKSRQIAEIVTKYETEKKEQEITSQKKEIQLKTSQRDTYLITLVVALSLTIGLVFIYQQRQRAIAQLRKKEKNLYDQKVDDLLKDEEIKSLNAMMSGQENERKRIAEDLHDRLGSKLAAVKLHYDASAEKVGSDTSFKKAAKILDDTIAETRKIAHNLLSGVLTKFGLIAALEDLKNTIEGTKEITFELNASNIDDRLPNDLEINIYRIVQELISNMLKHAQAKNISVQLTKHDDNSLTLMVEDDGIGFNTLEKKDGIGLQNMQARAEKFDGEIMIDSTIGRGTTTTVNLQIPQS